MSVILILSLGLILNLLRLGFLQYDCGISNLLPVYEIEFYCKELFS